MLLSPRIGTRQLANLCSRLSTSLEAGLDLRKVWGQEADRAGALAARSRFCKVSEAVNNGESLAEALDSTGDYFPVLFRELTRVGEQTGHQGEAFGHLATHYQNQLRLRRLFLAAIAWPLFQLSTAVLVVGLLIWIVGMIGQSTGTTIDILGWGLVGNRGLAIYSAVVALIGLAVAGLIFAVGRGLAWTRPIQHLVMRVPQLGKALETLAIARLAWVLQLTQNAGMALRPSLKLALESTGNARYIDAVPAVDEVIARGDTIEEAFRASGVFPQEFLDAVLVGEQSGRLVESLAVLSRQYHERADAAMRILTMFAGFAVWVLIAAIIIMVIFRIFFVAWLGPIQEALPK
jgi:type IV pilus assembly protein PilC